MKVYPGGFLMRKKRDKAINCFLIIAEEKGGQLLIIINKVIK